MGQNLERDGLLTEKMDQTWPNYAAPWVPVKKFDPNFENHSLHHQSSPDITSLPELSGSGKVGLGAAACARKIKVFEVVLAVFGAIQHGKLETLQ